MRILLTGASGWLGRTLAPRLRALGHVVVGLDPAPSQHVAARRLGRRPRLRPAGDRRKGIEAIVHSRRPSQARHRAPAARGFHRGQHPRHVQPPGGGGRQRRRPLRVHLDHVADDLGIDPRRAGGRGRARRLADRGHGRPSRATSTASPSSRPNICAGSTICSPDCRRSCCAPRGSSRKPTTWRTRSRSRTRTPRRTNCCFAG